MTAVEPYSPPGAGLAAFLGGVAVGFLIRTDPCRGATLAVGISFARILVDLGVLGLVETNGDLVQTLAGLCLVSLGVLGLSGFAIPGDFLGRWIRECVVRVTAARPPAYGLRCGGFRHRNE